MKKLCKVLALILSFALLLALASCGNESPGESSNPPQESAPAESSQPTEPEKTDHYLSIVWPTLSIDFYTAMADLMKGQAEEAGWKVDVVSYDFNAATQVTQLENCEAMGVTDIITCALDPNAVEDVCVRLRQKGININMFAMAPANLDAYDSVTVADQYQIGEAIAQNASDWVDATFPDADEGSIDAVIIELPSDAENIKRDRGMETISNNSKINVVRIYELGAEDPVEAQNAIDMMMLEYPETKVVLCHFASLSLAADVTAMSYEGIDRDHFGIFSGDWDTELAARIQASVNNESLIRATGTYSTNAMEIQFHVCAGEYDDQLNDQKQYVYPIVRITPENIGEYLQ